MQSKAPPWTWKAEADSLGLSTKSRKRGRLLPVAVGAAAAPRDVLPVIHRPSVRSCRPNSTRAFGPNHRTTKTLLRLLSVETSSVALTKEFVEATRRRSIPESPLPQVPLAAAAQQQRGHREETCVRTRLSNRPCDFCTQLEEGWRQAVRVSHLARVSYPSSCSRSGSSASSSGICTKQTACHVGRAPRDRYKAASTFFETFDRRLRGCLPRCRVRCPR